jgi:hypothetical protein
VRNSLTIDRGRIPTQTPKKKGVKNVKDGSTNISPLNAELNPIRHLLEVAGAHHFVDVSRIRVNCIIKSGNESIIFISEPIKAEEDSTLICLEGQICWSDLSRA